MKYCENCGAANKDENQFCSECGRELKTTEGTPNANPGESPYVQPPIVQQGQPQFFAQPVDSAYTYSNPSAGGYPEVILSARKVLSSPLLIAAVVLLAIRAVISVISSIFTSKLWFTQTQALNGNTRNVNFSSSSSILAIIPFLLIIAGLLMIYFSAKKTNMPMSTSGFTMLRVINIIMLIFLCIGILALLLFALVFLAGGSSIASAIFSKTGMDVSALIKIIGIVFLILACVVGTLGITFYASSIQLLGSMGQTFQTGYPSSKGAGVFSVFCYLFGCVSALASILAFLMLSYVAGRLSVVNNFISTYNINLANLLNPTAYIPSLITSLIGAVNYIILGALASKYKKAINRY